MGLACGSECNGPVKEGKVSLLACRTAFEEGDHSSYEITDSAYGVSDDEYLWVDRLLNTLAIMLQWFQPLLTMNNYDSLVSNLLAKVRINTPLTTGKEAVLSTSLVDRSLLPRLFRACFAVSVSVIVGHQKTHCISSRLCSVLFGTPQKRGSLLSDCDDIPDQQMLTVPQSWHRWWIV